ncbi:MAG TPA: adenylyltransferase/cytidyltransferase family protein [Candidatus Deferrimicrobiaceae bacterium]|nr:adenylyltransferase/cytidyltransferase family protein [Candidatus Deferrimicrobiaceae bacterium]
MANKTAKPKIVLASGVFDLLHIGHVRFLEDAKKAGGASAKLVVIIAKDTTVERIKGRKPIMSEDQRLALVESLKVVDEAVMGYEGLDIGEVIDKIKPDVIALGWDQDEMENQVKAYAKPHKEAIKVVRIGKYAQNALDSSSKIRQKIKLSESTG